MTISRVDRYNRAIARVSNPACFVVLLRKKSTIVQIEFELNVYSVESWRSTIVAQSPW